MDRLKLSRKHATSLDEQVNNGRINGKLEEPVGWDRGVASTPKTRPKTWDRLCTTTHYRIHAFMHARTHSRTHAPQRVCWLADTLPVNTLFHRTYWLVWRPRWGINKAPIGKHKHCRFAVVCSVFSLCTPHSHQRRMEKSIVVRSRPHHCSISPGSWPRPYIWCLLIRGLESSGE